MPWTLGSHSCRITVLTPRALLSSFTNMDKIKIICCDFLPFFSPFIWSVVFSLMWISYHSPDNICYHQSEPWHLPGCTLLGSFDPCDPKLQHVSDEPLVRPVALELLNGNPYLPAFDLELPLKASVLPPVLLDVARDCNRVRASDITSATGAVDLIYCCCG